DLLLRADGQLQGVADRLLWKGSGSAVALSSETQIDGGRILLNSPSSASDPVEDQSCEPTIIELVDQQGNPIPNQPFRVVLEDGSERSGVVDDRGRAELDIESSGRVYFPGLRPPQSG